MPITVKILADSVAPCGKRLTTMEWKYPRGIHSEIMTHKMLSKNSASSRAIPTATLIQSVLDDPFVPEYIGANQKGMRAGDELSGETRIAAEWQWLAARDQAVERARAMLALGVHKQVVNRVIEPWMWITIIVSATEWDNVWGLRCHPMAEPHFQKLAYMARDAMASSTPRVLKAGEWHLPLVDYARDWRDVFGMIYPDARLNESATPWAFEPREVRETVEKILIKVSVGRCARVSYLTHDGRRAIDEDVALHDRLIVQTPLHATPAEHAAYALDYPQWYKDWAPRDAALPPLHEIQERVLARRDGTCRGREFTQEHMIEEAVLAQMRSGNFIGFRQYRKTLPNEHIGGRMP